MGIFEEKLTRKYTQLSFTRFCKYLNQKPRGIGEKDPSSKTKKNKKHEKSQFHNSI